MRDAGTWTRPLLNGRDFHQKPFLPFALIRLSYAALGVSETAARLPSALLGIATAVLTAMSASRLCGRAAGLRAGIVLSSSLLFLLVCRSSMTDSAFLFFLTLCMWLFLECAARERPRAWELAAMYASAGLATLCKGPIGVLLPAGIGLAVLARRRVAETFAGVGRFRPVAGAAIVAAVALPWYAASAARTGGGSFREFLLRENLGRFLAPMEGHRGPFWIYIPVLLLAFLPWSVFLPGAWRAVADPRVRRIVGAWVAVPFVLFSAAATKLPHYLLPVFPPLAILVGAGWNGPSRPRNSRSFPLAALFVLGLVFPAALLAAKARRPELVPGALVATAAVFPCAAAAAFFFRARSSVLLAILAGSMGLFAWLACGWSLPALGDRRVVRPVGILLRDHVPLPTYSYRFLEPGLLFYARRTIERLDRPEEVGRISDSHASFAIVARAQDLETLSRAARRPLVRVGEFRGFCEDTGPIELVVLAAGF